MKKILAICWVLVLLIFAGLLQGQNEHHRQVNERGDRVMGFDHKKTTHHFILNENGGVIEITTKEDQDMESRSLIRSHLKEIAALFKNGDFAKPKEIHARVVPGSETMAKLKEKIEYRYEEIEKGGRVVIRTENEEAKNAIREFLKFQMSDHEGSLHSGH